VCEGYEILYAKHQIANKARIRNIGVTTKRPQTPYTYLPSFTRFKRHSWRPKESGREAVLSLNSVHQIKSTYVRQTILSLTDYGPLSNVVPKQAIRASLEILSTTLRLCRLSRPLYTRYPPPLIPSTHSQTCNALGRVVAGNPKSLPSNITIYSQSTHLRTIDLSLHLTDFGPVPGPLRLHVPIPLAPSV